MESLKNVKHDLPNQFCVGLVKGFFTCCHNCINRRVGCHSKCEQYLSDKEQYLSLKEKIKKENIITSSHRRGIFCSTPYKHKVYFDKKSEKYIYYK